MAPKREATSSPTGREDGPRCGSGGPFPKRPCRESWRFILPEVHIACPSVGASCPSHILYIACPSIERRHAKNTRPLISKKRAFLQRIIGRAPASWLYPHIPALHPAKRRRPISHQSPAPRFIQRLGQPGRGRRAKGCPVRAFEVFGIQCAVPQKTFPGAPGIPIRRKIWCPILPHR